MSIKKLVREKIPVEFKPGESEIITDKSELNNLYALKVKEELIEIQQADHKDIMEFCDLIEVAYAFAEQNGFPRQDIDLHRLGKQDRKGTFTNVALNNLNPNNPSNDIYFKESYKKDLNPKKLLNDHILDNTPLGFVSDKQETVILYESSLDAIKEVISLI